MNRFLFRAMLAISSTIAALAPLYAARPVSGGPLADWVQTVNQMLDNAMVAPVGESSGTVRVDFHRGSDGVPTDVVILATNADLRRAAQKTVSQVGILPPLPAGYGPDQQISMQLLFWSNDQNAYSRQRTAMLASATRKNQEVAANRDNTRVALARPQD